MNDMKVAIIMGSQSDWPVMKNAVIVLESLGIDDISMRGVMTSETVLVL